ncbi:MAG TPA: AMIN domain-containing protein [Candidatus Binatia bacterium]|nr:AMIN domain-containing protein [Candidatus Binatia bacterium]
MASGLLPNAPVRRVFRVGWWSWLVVVVVAAGGASARGSAPDAGGGRAGDGSSLRIERVEVLARPHPAVRLVLSAPATPVAHALAAHGGEPERLYVDVPGAALGPGVRAAIPGVGPLRRVRTARQADGTARVVIETARRLPFTLATAGDGVTVVFGAPAAAPTKAARRQPKPEKPVAKEAASPPPAPVSAPEEPGPPSPVEPTPAAAPAAPAAPAPAMALVGGARVLWPPLDDPAYAAAAGSPLRKALEAWRQGERPRAPIPPPQSPAELYLAADLAYLEAVSGGGDLLAARDAYQRALREAADFPDAARGELMLGLANLRLGFAPEAGAAFRALVERHPESPLVPLARIGGATALRLMHRPEQALQAVEAALSAADGGALCDARVEQAADASALGRATEAADAFRSAVALCPDLLAQPGTLYAYAKTLADGGARAEARRLLAGPHPPLDAAQEARLGLLAGALALADGDETAARQLWGQVAQGPAPPAQRTEAETRLAELDGAKDPAAAAAALTRLADAAASIPARIDALVGAARATAAAGRADEAMALLDRASHLGPDGATKAAGARTALISRWLHDADVRDDAAGVASLYAAYATTIEAQAPADDRLLIARALGRLGLHAEAVRMLGGIHDRTPEVEVALAEEALAAGNLAAAGAAAAAVGGDADPALAARARRVTVRVALASGDPNVAADALPPDDPMLRAEVAEALLARPGGAARARAVLAPALEGTAPVGAEVLLAAGDAAAATGDWAAATQDYGRALDGETTGPMRVRAAAGLARAALARGDAPGAAAALGRVGAVDDAVVRQAVAAAVEVLGRGAAWRQADAR